MRRIRKAAVIGSGVMGSGIAAHLANIGIPSILLDIVPEELTPMEKKHGATLADQSVRNRHSLEAIKKLQGQKPPPLATKQRLSYIESGNLEDDLHKLKTVDWIIEAVVENLNVKKEIMRMIEPVRKPEAIVTSNTSGISIEEIAAGCSDEFSAHFLGAHFFNPPRYLPLLELIPTSRTNNEVTTFMKAFAETTLGKGVVLCKDTPNFIANRIGTFSLLSTVKEMLANGYTIGEVDSVTGPLLGRPKSATFRTLDVVGLDTFLHVAQNVTKVATGREREVMTPPVFIREMVDKGWIGSKSGQGFYKKQPDGILEINPHTLEYERRKKLQAPSIEQARKAKNEREKIKIVANADDRAGRLVWAILKSLLLFSAEKVNEIANEIQSIDQAMKWGFGWELGPFEIWDVLGVAETVARMEQEGETVPDWIKKMLDEGFDRFYQGGSFYNQGHYESPAVSEKIIHFPKADKLIMKNAGASLHDIGDGVALLEFHSETNSIGLDAIQMIRKSIDEVEQNYQGLVIGNYGKNFCVGANLMLLLMEAQDDNYPEIDYVVRQFQQAAAAIRYAAVPVVTAPYGMTLGGGAEICLPSASIQAALETYIGLVEVGVGLIPGGGGNKELYLRQLERLPQGIKLDLQPIANAVFETIAMAKVSTSAEEARETGFFSERDDWIVNQALIIAEAKQQVIHLAEKGYRPPQKRPIPVIGETGYATMLLGATAMKTGGRISEHDLKIADKLAFVIAGGRVAKGAYVDEQYLLDLEREAFLSLIGEPKTQQRMQHMLLKRKPLRN